MIRFVGMLIVIWGLIIQPLMAATMPAKKTPTKMMTESTLSAAGMVFDIGMVVDLAADLEASVSTDGHHDNHPISSGAESKAPCHENADESSSEHCDQCGDNCTSGLCATSCVVGSGVAAFQKILLNLSLNHNTLVSTSAETCSYEHPSRIFHPPKHA